MRKTVFLCLMLVVGCILAEGMKKGEMYGLIKTARNMKIEGMEVSLIAKMTGLTEEEVDKL